MKTKFLLTILVLFAGFESMGFEVWNQKANMPATARHRTVAFSVGNKGYMGLGHYNSGPNGNTYLEDIWEYDPASNTWTQKADFAGGRRYHAVGVGYKNIAFVGTGRDQTNAPPDQTYTLETDWWKFDPIANSWTLMAPMPGVGRRGAVHFVIDSLIFVGTGQVSGGYTADFYAYDAENDQWLAGVPPFPGGARISAIAFSIEDKGYVGTGGVGCGNTDFYEYKRSTNTWNLRANVGGPIRIEACAFAVNGKGYVLTGDNCSSGTNYKDFWEYDPNTDVWTELEEFPGAARRYMNSFVIGKKVFVGSGTSGVNYNDLWEYDQTLSTLKQEKDLLETNVYPNPATEFINFSLSNLPSHLSSEELQLKVHSINGSEIHQEQFQSNLIQLNCSEFNAGMYIYSIWYEGQAVRHGKLAVH